MDLEKQKEYYIENCLMGEKTTWKQINKQKSLQQKMF
jgi:hypothetical protein